jgi:hypothetical protein
LRALRFDHAPDGWLADIGHTLRKLAPAIPVIVASGHDEGQIMIGYHPERPDAFLHKPFSMNNEKAGKSVSGDLIMI